MVFMLSATLKKMGLSLKCKNLTGFSLCCRLLFFFPDCFVVLFPLFYVSCDFFTGSCTEVQPKIKLATGVQLFCC